MLNFLKRIDIPFKTYSIASILIGILTIFIIFLVKNHLPPTVPLFYGLAQGEEQLASTPLLILPSLISVIVLVVNCGLALLTKDVFLKKVLVLSGIATLVFSLTTTLRIIFLVGSF